MVVLQKYFYFGTSIVKKSNRMLENTFDCDLSMLFQS
jgi:hypothetical protein